MSRDYPITADYLILQRVPVGGVHNLYHMTLPCCTNITVSGLGPCHIFLDILNLPHITTDQPQFTYQIS